MSRGINKVQLVGNLGRDPDKKEKVTVVSLATGEQWRDKDTGEQKEKTEWHRVVFFGRLAEIASEYLRKGSRLYVEGRLQTRKWQDNNGADRYTTEIVAKEMLMLSGEQQSAPAEPAVSGGRVTVQPHDSGGGIRDMKDDDIPF